MYLHAAYEQIEKVYSQILFTFNIANNNVININVIMFCDNIETITFCIEYDGKRYMSQVTRTSI